MIVLLDLEWIEKGGKHLTQLSALRTDENWDTVESLEIFVKPKAVCFKAPKHVAFGGLSTELYENAMPEQECITGFAQWLRPEDQIWVWAQSNRELLLDLWQRYCPERDLPVVRSTAGKGRGLALKDGHPEQNPYAILTAYGQTPPRPEHRASNDTEVMRRVFICLGMAPDCFQAASPKAPKVKGPVSKECQREVNRKMIDRTGYNFVYLKGSSVFHRRSCKACLAAKSESDILGAVYYETAAKDRRPCKICCPVPLEDDKKREEKQWAETRQQGFPKNIVKVKLLTGQVIYIKAKNVIGWCHYRLHRGALNKALLKEHDCLGKNCPHLSRNSQSPYWEALKAQEQAKEERKRKLREKKKQQEAEENQLRSLAESWQSYLDDMGSDMYIVRVAKDAPSVYRIFYVSDNRFADGDRYPNLLETLKWVHPHYRIILRHIRDVDGHFVTYDEYMSRARK